MLGVDPEFGASLLRLWVAAGSAVLLILFCVVALLQPQLRLTSSPLRRVGFVLAGAVLGGLIAFAFIGRTSLSNGGTERDTFEMRAQRLNALALAPGSPLACLDALAGESVATACEKVLFGSPANVAAASSYVAAQLTLFSSAATYAQRRGADLEDVLAPLRRSLETDRFGFVAHVLAVREGCDAQNCKALALLRDASRVRANLSTATLDHYLEHYATQWASEVPVAEGAQPQATAANGQPTHKVVNIDFPTAASIPAVSIMNPEPNGPVLPGVAAAAAANPNAAPGGSSSTRHARRQAASPQSPAAPAPIQSSAAVEPIWPEPMPPSAPAAPQTAPVPPAAAPVPLAPSPPNGSAARTQ
jgi:hypothetical protein